MKKGKFIVLDGTDGSGKATQAALLVKKLKKEGYRVVVEDFPQYGKKSAGLVEEYLNGVYGTAKELGPYVPSVFYAVDRFAAKKRIENNLKKGYVVVSNRYVTASTGHQGGKIKNKRERNEFYKWLDELEYDFFNIPRPDLTILLYVPPRIAQLLVDKKKSRAYTKGKKRDMHEKDLRHLTDAANVYIEISKKFNYPIIYCSKGGKLFSREEVSDMIWKKVTPILPK